MNRAHYWLYRYSQFVVAATFALIFLGGMVTSKNAGLAVPDWPTSFNYNMFTFPLAKWFGVSGIEWEHSHRLLASGVGVLTAILAAWIWRNFWALIPAAILSGIPGMIVGVMEKHGALAPKWAEQSPHDAIIGILSIWPSAVILIVLFVAMQKRQQSPHSALLRWLAVAAGIGVCLQGTLGGLRVTEQSLALATIHGCVAQLFLCNLIGIAFLLSPFYVAANRETSAITLRGIRTASWWLAGVVFVQLIVGSIMRHLSAGLSIPYFPSVSAHGGYLPQFGKNPMVDLNFMHTRMGAFVVSALVVLVLALIFTKAIREKRLVAPAILLLLLVVFQIELGMHIIWLRRPPVTTTLHVLNGAAVLGMTLLIALRATTLQRRASLTANTTANGALR